MALDVHSCFACHETSLQPFPDFYVCTACGLISARDRRTTQVYDQKYVADRYDRYETTEDMSLLRLDVLSALLHLQENVPAGKLSRVTGTLLDVGYGNGSFLRTATKANWQCYGHDVNPTIYEGVRSNPLPITPLPLPFHYKVITFFDALEHFEDLAAVRRVAYNTQYILLSFPLYPNDFLVDPTKWKHYRPGEHHHYFTPASIAKLFTLPERKAELIYVGYPEDAIRGSLKDGRPNIVSCAVRMRTVSGVYR